MAQTVEKQSPVKRAKYSRFVWPILRAIALTVAMWAFIPYISVLLYGGESRTAVLAFAVASFALIAMTPKQETPHALEADKAMTGMWRRLPWSFIVYCAITGIGYNWVCAYLWFSRRYAVFSGPVVGVMGVILALYGGVGIVVARLTRRKWRVALLIFALVQCALGGIAQRLLR